MWKNVEFLVISDGTSGDVDPVEALHGVAREMIVNDENTIYFTLWGGTTIKIPGTDVHKIELCKTASQKGVINFGYNCTVYLYRDK